MSIPHRISRLIGLPLMAALAGCATTHGQTLSSQEMQGRLLHLENIAEQRDQELAQLRSDLETERDARQTLERRLSGGSSAGSAQAAAATAGGITIREVQLALRRAGFDPGAADGKMGKRTREALRSFQQAQGLRPDGRIGPQTVAKLKTYLTPSTSGESPTK